MSAKSEIKVLADFILAEVEGEPSQSEGAGTTAVRIIKQLQAALAEKSRILIEEIKVRDACIVHLEAANKQIEEREKAIEILTGSVESLQRQMGIIERAKAAERQVNSRCSFAD